MDSNEYEYCLYTRISKGGGSLKAAGEYFNYYNDELYHEALDYRAPSGVCFVTSASLMPTAAVVV
jgi:hypothetical protein